MNPRSRWGRLQISPAETFNYGRGNIDVAEFNGPLELNWFQIADRLLIQAPTSDIIDPIEFDLSGLDSIDLDEARRITRQPWYVNLSGLEMLDVETAEVLAGHMGTLCLTGLRQLSIQAAEALSKHEGPVLLDRGQLPAEIMAIVEPTCR